MKRYHLLVKGKVQGVGFRFFCQYTALQHNLTGLAKNLYDGDVEVEVQGEEADIYSFLEKIKAGNRFIQVIDIKMDERPSVETETGFRTK